MVAEFKRLDLWLVDLAQRCSQSALRVSVGIIYLVFGALKLFPNFSPAEELAYRTVGIVTFGILEGNLAMCVLAFLEVSIGLFLISGFALKWTVRFALWHMLCTFLPMILLPSETFTQAPISLSLMGQYIFKNLVIISALFSVYSNGGSESIQRTNG